MHLCATITPSIVLSVRRKAQFAQQLSLSTFLSSLLDTQKEGIKGTFYGSPNPLPWPQLYHVSLNLSIEKFSISVFLYLIVSTPERECPALPPVGKTGCLFRSCRSHKLHAVRRCIIPPIRHRLTACKRPESAVSTSFSRYAEIGRAHV